MRRTRGRLSYSIGWGAVYGFTVWSAANGPAALEVYRRQQDDIAVVLLDVRMPGLDGPQTLAELQRLNPRPPPASSSWTTTR